VIGNACISTKNTTMETKVSTTGNKEKNDKIKRRMDRKGDNEKLSFLKNPVRRPYGLVESVDKKDESDMPAYSLATASRMANVEPGKDCEVPNRTKSKEAPHFNSSDASNLDASSGFGLEKKASVNIDFNNLDDEIRDQDQGQSQQFNHSDNRSANNDNTSQDGDEPLTFKPENLLKAKDTSSNDVPMSFGGGMLGN